MCLRLEVGEEDAADGVFCLRFGFSDLKSVVLWCYTVFNGYLLTVDGQAAEVSRCDRYML